MTKKPMYIWYHQTSAFSLFEEQKVIVMEFLESSSCDFCMSVDVTTTLCMSVYCDYQNTEPSLTASQLTTAGGKQPHLYHHDVAFALRLL